MEGTVGRTVVLRSTYSLAPTSRPAETTWYVTPLLVLTWDTTAAAALASDGGGAASVEALGGGERLSVQLRRPAVRPASATRAWGFRICARPYERTALGARAGRTDVWCHRVAVERNHVSRRERRPRTR